MGAGWPLASPAFPLFFHLPKTPIRLSRAPPFLSHHFEGGEMGGKKERKGGEKGEGKCN